MPTNGIKYSVTPQTEALKKGNFWISTGDVDKGPTPSSGYYISITPPSGGYSVYLNKPSDGPSIYTPPNDNDLIVLAQGLSGQTFATGASALNWFASQTDKMACNIDYPPVITNGLVLNLDAGFTPSYPRTGTTLYDTSSNGFNSTLTNGPTYNSNYGGSIVFDGTNDYVLTGNILQFSPTDSFTMSVIFYLSSISGDNTIFRNTTIFGRGSTTGSVGIGAQKSTTNVYSLQIGSRGVNSLQTTYSLVLDQIYFVTFIYDGAAQLSATTNQYVYINGVLRGTQNITSGLGGTFATAGYASFINRAVPGGNSTYSSGGLFYSSLYNRSLSSAEVFQNYQAFLSRFIDPGIATSGLVLYLDAANPFYAGSGTSWADASGNRNTGTLVNGPTYATGNGGAIVFDGTDDYVSVSSSQTLNIVGDLTLSAWIKATGNSGIYRTIFGKYYTNNNPTYEMGISNGSKLYWYGNGVDKYGPTNISLDTFYCFTITINSSAKTGKMYINGQIELSMSGLANQLSNNGPLYVGVDAPSGVSEGSFFKGNIYVGLIYNRALSDSEVLQNYNAQKSRFGL